MWQQSKHYPSYRDQRRAAAAQRRAWLDSLNRRSR